MHDESLMNGIVGDGLVPSRAAARRGRACPVPRRRDPNGAGDHKGRPYGAPRICRTPAGAVWVVAFSFIVYKAWEARPLDPPADGWRVAGDFVLGVLAEFGAVGISIAILAMVFVGAVHTIGGLLMTLNQFLVNRFVLPVIEAHKAEGRAEGREEARAEWRAWYERRLDAERRGREFAEPPPGG